MMKGTDATASAPQLVKKASQSSRRARREKREIRFSGDLCVGKTHLGLQTCELSVADGQFVRCRRPQPTRKSGRATFSTV
jgi:hypothetical protein